MSIQIPKLYLLDLIHYILKNNDNDNIIHQYNSNARQINSFNSHIDYVFNHTNAKDFIFLQLEPSMNSYINVLFEDKTNIIGIELNDLNEYLKNKMIECIYLGLLFNGCLPNLMKPILDNGSNIFNIRLKDRKLFYFNPLNNNGNSFQNLRRFEDDTQYDSLPLPFNYYNYNIGTRNRLYPLKSKYFIYIPNRYRPPYVESKKLLFENQINSYNKILEHLFKLNENSFTTIFKKLLSERQKISKIYYELFITSKLILNNQQIINKKLENNIKLFDINKLTTNLNNINAYIYLYYYLYKYDKVTFLPEFIYYKLDSDKYLLYRDTRLGPQPLGSQLEGNYELIGGSYELVGGSYNNLIGGSIDLSNLQFMKQFYFGPIDIRVESFLIDKDLKLPPSLIDNLEDFYQLTKIKFITDILNDLLNIFNELPELFKSKLNMNPYDKDNFIYIKTAKLIEEIIKDYAEYTLKISIDNTLLNRITNINEYYPDISLQNKTYQVTTILRNSVNDLNSIYTDLTDRNKKLLLNFYNFSDPNINEKCNFIIYPNEYTNTTLLQQKYCIKIESTIIDQLLSKNGQPLLLDNNNKTCINYLISTFNCDVLDILNKKHILQPMIHQNDILFVETELKNHINKMYSGSYINTFENFTKAQYEEIKLLILSDETNGNNILFNLKNSFYICFYICIIYFIHKFIYNI